MQLYEKLVSGDEKLALVGLGYVGMPIAVAFSKKVKVVGFDLNAKTRPMKSATRLLRIALSSLRRTKASSRRQGL